MWIAHLEFNICEQEAINGIDQSRLTITELYGVYKGTHLLFNFIETTINIKHTYDNNKNENEPLNSKNRIKLPDKNRLVLIISYFSNNLLVDGNGLSGRQFHESFNLPLVVFIDLVREQLVDMLLITLVPL